MSRFLLAILVVTLAGYGLFEARRVLAGPQIVIDTPIDGTSTSSPLVTITGTAKNVSFLTINDKPSRTDQNHRFREVFAPPPGYTEVTVAATDRFGRRASDHVRITVLNYCPIHHG